MLPAFFDEISIREKYSLDAVLEFPWLFGSTTRDFAFHELRYKKTKKATMEANNDPIISQTISMFVSQTPLHFISTF